MRRVLLSLVVAIAGAGCGGNSAPAPVPTPAPARVQHLYQAGQYGDLEADLVAQYSLPLTSGSVPNFTLSTEPNLVAVAVDAGGTLAVGNATGQIKVYPGPFSPSSKAAATFASGFPTIGQIAFGPAGTMFVTAGSSPYGAPVVYMFVPPFSNASTPSLTFNLFGYAGGVAVDSSGNLYVGSNVVGIPFHGNIVVFMFPYTSPPIVTPLLANVHYGQMALSGSRLFAVLDWEMPGVVHVYTLPITETSTPLAIGSSATRSFTQSANSVALDAAGNLYVQNTTPNEITSWATPSYTGMMSTLNTTGGSSIAIGP